MQFTVNLRKILYLTDFLKCTFRGENAKNRAFCGGINARPMPFTILLFTMTHEMRKLTLFLLAVRKTPAPALGAEAPLHAPRADSGFGRVEQRSLF
jgi:hypothetical protein